MTVSLSTSATEQITSFLKDKPHSIGIRLGVKTTGCSGLAYTMEVANEKNDYEESYKIGSVNILIDKKNLIYLQGTKLDFVQEGLNSGFTFNNPNSKGECGCGESFSV